MILLLKQIRGEPTDGVVHTPFWKPAGICLPLFDRVVIHEYLSGLSRPGQVAYFFREVVGEPVIGKEVLPRRTNEYQAWVEWFARNHCPIEWAGPGRRIEREKRYGVYFILKRLEKGTYAMPTAESRESVGERLRHRS